jgi:hypothetical protein
MLRAGSGAAPRGHGKSLEVMENSCQIMLKAYFT